MGSRVRRLLSLLLLAAVPALLAGGAYDETYRPQIHFTPARHWMNDPNGLVYLDGEYHLFFQYNPFGDSWGHMSWGHAVSGDLVHWTELPVAIPEAGEVMAFSGSAVVDWHNTSGLGTGGRPPLVALYTGYREKANGAQAQYLAYSNDRGRTWSTYSQGPVLDLHVPDFRDPKVSWYAPGGCWLMTVSLAANRQIAFFRSPNLKDWTALGRFGPAGSTVGVWECPDLFPLPVEGSPGTSRWVLIVNVGDGAPAGGSGTQYFVGAFDGSVFSADTVDGAVPTRWLDHGRDFYAAVTWGDIPASDGRRLVLGWMNNWKYGKTIPTSPWRSAQSLVRVLTLARTNGGLVLRQTPAAEYAGLRRGEPVSVRESLDGGGTVPFRDLRDQGGACEVTVAFELGRATEAGLVFGKGPGATRLRYDRAQGLLSIERAAGDFADPGFPGIHSAPVPAPNGRLALHLYLDRSSLEVFADGGLVTLTDQFFLKGADSLAAYAAGDGARVEATEWALASIWR